MFKKRGDWLFLARYSNLSCIVGWSACRLSMSWFSVFGRSSVFVTSRICSQCLTIIEAWEKVLDHEHNAGAVLTDLSKAFDCLHHKLLIAKLDAYGLHKEALKFIYNYLKDRKHRTKVNNSYSSLRDIWSTTRNLFWPLLFNIFINDIFLQRENKNWKLCRW